MRKIMVAVTLLYIASAIAVLGLLSNWFRYGFSLEGMFVVGTLVLSSVVVLTITFFAYQRFSPSLSAALVAAIFASILMVMASHREAFGTWFPSLSFNHVESSGIAELSTHGQTLRYRLELHNPFAESHREYLVISRGARDEQIQLPVFEMIPGGYLGAAQPEDWIVLRPTADKDVYEVKIGYRVAEKLFIVNLQTKEVITLATKQPAERSPNKALNPDAANNATPVS